jgi:hypothetical protein
MNENIAKKFSPVGKSKVINGTLTIPNASGLRLICVLASEKGEFDSPVYKLLDKKWATIKTAAKGWRQENIHFKMGNLRDCAVNSDIWVVSLLCVKKDGTLDEKALATCFKKLSQMALSDKGTVHFSSTVADEHPQFFDMAQTQLVEKGINVFYYVEPGTK